jgi:hypothetical protein
MQTSATKSCDQAPVRLWALLLVIVGACSSSPMPSGTRSLDAPVSATKRFVDQFLSPAAIGRDLGRMRTRGAQLGGQELDLGTSRTTAATMFAPELRRPRAAADRTESMLGVEADRLGTLRHSEGFEALSPMPDVQDLARDLRHLPTTLRLDRRMMSEPEDLQHRTSLDDDRPEASFADRFWRRILP